jgi:cell division protein FtsZ
MNDENNIIDSFGFPKKPQSNLMALGVGGAGGNAVNHMYDLGIREVTFMVCNTDRQALDRSPVGIKVQLGSGLGAGNNPNKGRQAAIESLDEIVLRFEQEGTDMVFITAGMGGGTGTGAAPVIAKAARDKGILTVGIVTLPFAVEGRKRIEQAYRGLEEMRKNVDSMVVIHNENISKIYGSLPLDQAFAKADDIVAAAAKGIADLINKGRLVNVDLEDVRTVMTDAGMALMGTGRASGDDRIERVTEEVLASPLLNHQDIRGAKDILLNFSYGPGRLTFNELENIMANIQKKASKNIGERNAANIIWGAGDDESLTDEVTLTLVATGFDSVDMTDPKPGQPEPKIILGGAGGGIDVVLPPTGTIKILGKSRIPEVDKYLATPSYVRRNVRLSSAGPAGKGAVSIKEDTENAARGETKEGNLFGE